MSPPGSVPPAGPGRPSGSSPPDRLGWPALLQLARHAQSAGNVARELAYARGAEEIDIDVPDPAVPMSAAGIRQAQALGDKLAGQPGGPPEVLLVSPYRRTQETAQLVLAALGAAAPTVQFDERLRDREQGVLDRLTWSGVLSRYPAEAERRASLGKFWYRPPGGESWADVAARVRAVLLELRLSYPGQRVLVVAHDVPILLVRYALEGLSIEAVLALSGTLANAGLVGYDFPGHAPRLLTPPAGTAGPRSPARPR